MTVHLGYLHSADIAASFHDSLEALASYDATHDQLLRTKSALRTSSGGIPQGRNTLAARTLEETDEWLFMVDSDMGFHPDALHRLMEVADPAERPIVGGLCFAYREFGMDGKGGYRAQPKPTIFDWVQHEDGHTRFTGLNHFPVNSVMRCAATGAALLLIHRSVLQRVADEYGPVWFDRVRGTDGQWLGEDVSFFVRTAALEIPCHVHTGVKTSHKKTIYVSDVDFWESFIPPPATETFWVVGDFDDESWLTLEATTGLLSDGADWLFVGDKPRFRPGWFDHAMHVADMYGADVVKVGDFHLIRSEFYSSHSSDVDYCVRAAKKAGTLQIAAGARVDS